MTFPSSMWFSPVRCLCGEVIRHTRALLRSRAAPANVNLELTVRADDAVLIGRSVALTDEAIKQLRRIWAAKYTGDAAGHIELLHTSSGHGADAHQQRARPIYRSIGLGWWQHMGWLTPRGHRITRGEARAREDFTINAGAAPLLSSPRGIEP